LYFLWDHSYGKTKIKMKQIFSNNIYLQEPSLWHTLSFVLYIFRYTPQKGSKLKKTRPPWFKTSDVKVEPLRMYEISNILFFLVSTKEKMLI
jgi:hypothetical protein